MLHHVRTKCPGVVPRLRHYIASRPIPKFIGLFLDSFLFEPFLFGDVWVKCVRTADNCANIAYIMCKEC